jgi:hypothetical protein
VASLLTIFLTIREAIMTPNAFTQVGKIWRAIAGSAGRDARVGDRMAAAGSRAAMPRFHGASAAVAVFCLILSTGSSFSTTYNNIPALFNLINLSTGFVCVSGPTGKGYYLAPSGTQGQLGWTMTQPAQQFYPVGYGTSQYSVVQTTFTGGYTNPITSAQLNFYLMPSGTSTCPAPDKMPSTIPVGLFEFNGSMNANVPAQGDTTYQLVIDTSNVNNFQVPLMFEVISLPTSTASAFIAAQLGNAAYSPHAAISTMVTNNAFPNWLKAVGGTGLQQTFGVLAQAATATSPAMINSTNKFLAGCLALATNPCSLLPQAGGNLFYYFDSELNNLLVSGLSTAADAQGTYTQAVWTASGGQTCPIYVNDNVKSLKFSSPNASWKTFNFCNPLNQVVPLPANSTVTCVTCPSGTSGQNQQTFSVCVTVPNSFTFSSYNNWYLGQPVGLAPVQSSSQNLGIISTAAITSSNCNQNPPLNTTSYNAQFSVWCYNPAAATYTCPQPGSGAWAVSNINVNLTSNCGGVLNVFETASQQVFANDGAFASWFNFYQDPPGCTGGVVTPLTVVAQSIGRNIVEALVHGVASCTSPGPGCAPVNLIINGNSMSYQCVTSPGSCPPNMYWSNQNNWFSTNGTQDYYSSYIHQAQLVGNQTAVPKSAPNNCIYTTTSWSTGPIYGLNNCSNISLPPNLYVYAQPSGPGCSGFSGFAQNASGWLMGMAYGSGFDETPNYLAPQPPAQPAGAFANLPSKLDPIPFCWFNQTQAGQGTASLGVNIVIGRAEPLAAHDLNGDSKSDIVWRDTSGDVAFWLMNGAAVTSTGGAGNVSTEWSIVGQRDFNGDGMVDLLWRDSSGDNAIWFMNGTQVASSASIAGLPTNWTVVGTGDFNGDGLGDILWEDNNGNLAVWLMNGPNVLATGSIGSAPANLWTVAGIGDFNGDGRADILWRDTSGDLAVWFMNGTAIASTAGVGNVPTTWTVVGTGDFNGDGLADIAWRDSSGNVGIWLMNGASVLAAGGLGNLATSWSMVQTGDYNGDGMSDLLWRDTSGNIAMWFMNGTAVASTGTVGNIAVLWTVQAVNAD